jgi:putative glycosyltransferase
MIDSDLEEAPELLSVYWEQLAKEPCTDVIYGIQNKRKGNWFERFSGGFYYRLFSFLSKQEYPANSLTARLMSKRYIDSLKEFSEKESDLWGVFMLAGFEQRGIVVEKGFKGRTTYSFRRKLGIGLATITTLTHRPLYLITLVGFILTLLSFIYAIVLLIEWITKGSIDRWYLLVGSIWMVGGIVVICMGVLSLYMSKMFLEIKNRPYSIIRKIHRKK